MPQPAKVALMILALMSIGLFIPLMMNKDREP